jgi:hypothetical protein
MSETLYEAFNEEQAELLTRIEARRIITGIKEARNNSESAGRRWPFELLQNAHDTGPYLGRNSVQVSIVLNQTSEGTTLVFEHDGAPFAVKELVALLAGGSSKEFESEETTGRFGTGFLVTHVLATKVRVRGILTNGDSLESFDLALERGGDEETIIRNIDISKLALRDAVSLERISNEKSASFEYLVDNLSAASLGLTAVRQALPYLFATCPNFGSFLLCDHEGNSETWTTEEKESSVYEDRTIKNILLLRRSSGTVEERYRSIAVSDSDESPAAIIVAKMSEGQWQVHLPEKTVPRIFRRLPIQSYSVPIVPVLDGNFDVHQDRQGLSLNDENKRLLGIALGNIPAAIQFAFREHWASKHLLAQIEAPSGSSSVNQDELDWWKQELTKLASSVAILAIVESRGRLGPALDGDDWSADFLLPQLNISSSEHTVALDRAWPLIDAISDLDPPELSVANEWTTIARNWTDLGLDVRLVALEDIADHLRNVGGLLNELPINGDKSGWLVTFLDVVGECWTKMKVEHLAALDGLLPNQQGRLCGHKELLRDSGISDSVKDIAQTLGIDIRARLFETKLVQAANSMGLNYFSNVLEKLLPATLTEDELIEQCVSLLNKKLVEDKEAPNDPILTNGSVRLFSHLWRNKGASAESVAKKCPLIAMDGTVMKWSSTRMMMAPVELWHPEARPFSGAYPPRRILSTLYAEGPEGLELGSALVTWGIAIRDPLTKSSPELKDKRLQGLAHDVSVTEGVTVNGVEFSHIALLTDAVLLHCQESVEYAKRLLGLVLKYIANHDDQWRIWREVKGTKDRKQVQISLRGAVWVSDLTTRAWVPVEGEGESSKAFAKAATLQDLLEPDWLIDNERGVELLSDCFGFDSLESRLLGVEPSKRQEMRDNLAKLVDVAKSDPAALSEFADEIEARESRKRDVGRWRRLGLAVQDAVQALLESRGLEVNVIDRGFDFEVLVKSDGELEEADLARLEIGPYFMEVKATTQGEVKMTPTQASHAAVNVERYALCVIDLRAIPEDELDRVWAAEDIEDLSHVVTNIGTYTIETTELIETAKGNEVGIRNESALRYGVPTAIWDMSFSLSKWVDSIVQVLSTTQKL